MRLETKSTGTGAAPFRWCLASLSAFSQTDRLVCSLVQALVTGVIFPISGLLPLCIFDTHRCQVKARLANWFICILIANRLTAVRCSRHQLG
ncbi:hypothetical protein BR93DRAFT_602344 [Coniochaeta sp. PMI_546]|nr:hypothetical protein BR93DRAFT_602344 [Coniochaeta sp. PMI_546]